MHRAGMLGCELTQMKQVEKAIAIPAKACVSVIAALNHMQRNPG
jgi:hypothetical protein